MPRLTSITQKSLTSTSVSDRVFYYLKKRLTNPNDAGVSRVNDDNADLFGNNIATSSDYIVTGAPSEDTDTFVQNSGVVYVYDAKTEVLIHTITSPNKLDQESFGFRVAISGTRIFVSSFGAETNFSSNIYVYDLANLTNTLTPQPSSTLRFSNPEGYFFTARELDVDGDYLIATDDRYNSDTGIMVVWDISDTSSIYIPETFIVQAPTSGDRHFYRARISDNTIATSMFRPPWDMNVYNLLTFPSSPNINEFYSVENVIENPNNYSSRASDSFGFDSVASSNNYLFVGASEEDEVGGTDSGVIYIFDNDDNLVYTIINPNAYSTPTSDRFGRAIAVEGNFLIAGVPNEDELSYSSSGKAYVFTTTTGDWTDTSLLYTLNNPNAYDTPSGDSFGYSVGISGNYFIVGAYGEDDANGTTSGKAYIYDLTTGNLLHTLDNPNPYSTSSVDYFGYSLDITDVYAVVGAWGEDEAGGSTSGKIYVFSPATGNLLRTIDNPNAFSTVGADRFSVRGFSISGDYLLVGVPDEDANLVGRSGVAYIFRLSTGNLIETLINPNLYSTESGDEFGYVVTMSGNYAAVQSYFEDDAKGPTSGAVYVYRTETGNWTDVTLIASIANPNYEGSSTSSERFGNALVFKGTTLYASSQEDYDEGVIDNSGVVYRLKLSSSKIIYTSNYIIENPQPLENYFGYQIALKGNILTTGSFFANGENNNSGEGYVYYISNLTATGNAPDHIFKNPIDNTVYHGVSTAIGDNYLAFMSRKAISIYKISNIKNSIIEKADFLITEYDDTLPVNNSTFANTLGLEFQGDKILFNVGYLTSRHIFIYEPIRDTLGFNPTPITLSSIEPQDERFASGWTNRQTVTSKYVFVGAYTHKVDEPDFVGPNRGRVYQYRREDGELLAIIDNPDTTYPDENQSFGRGVAANDKWLCISAEEYYKGTSSNSSVSGRVYVYDVETLDLVHIIDSPSIADPTIQIYQFPFTGMNLIHDKLVVGTSHDNINNGGGTVFVWNLSDEQPTYSTFGGQLSDYGSGSYGTSFGAYFYFNENWIVMGWGAWGPTNAEQNTGTVYVYDKDFNYQRTINRVAEGENVSTFAYGFGANIVLDGDIAYISSNNTFESTTRQGVIHVYNLSTGAYIESIQNPNLDGGLSTYDGFKPIAIRDGKLITHLGEGTGSRHYVYLFLDINNSYEIVNSIPGYRPFANIEPGDDNMLSRGVSPDNKTIVAQQKDKNPSIDIADINASEEVLLVFNDRTLDVDLITNGTIHNYYNGTTLAGSGWVTATTGSATADRYYSVTAQTSYIRLETTDAGSTSSVSQVVNLPKYKAGHPGDILEYSYIIGGYTLPANSSFTLEITNTDHDGSTTYVSKSNLEDFAGSVTHTGQFTLTEDIVQSLGKLTFKFTVTNNTTPATTARLDIKEVSLKLVTTPQVDYHLKYPTTVNEGDVFDLEVYAPNFQNYSLIQIERDYLFSEANDADVTSLSYYVVGKVETIGGLATLTVTATEDYRTEGQEQLRLRIGSEIYNIDIEDTSVALPSVASVFDSPYGIANTGSPRKMNIALQSDDTIGINMSYTTDIIDRQQNTILTLGADYTPEYTKTIVNDTPEPGPQRDTAEGIVVDSQDYFITADAFANDLNADSTTIWKITKQRPTGVENNWVTAWTKFLGYGSWASKPDERPAGIAVDANDDIIVAGSIYTSSIVGAGRRILVAKLDGVTGNLQWIKLFHNNANDTIDDFVNSVVVDKISNTVFISGQVDYDRVVASSTEPAPFILTLDGATGNKSGSLQSQISGSPDISLAYDNTKRNLFVGSRYIDQAFGTIYHNNSYLVTVYNNDTFDEGVHNNRFTVNPGPVWGATGADIDSIVEKRAKITVDETTGDMFIGFNIGDPSSGKGNSGISIFAYNPYHPTNLDPHEASSNLWYKKIFPVGYRYGEEITLGDIKVNSKRQLVISIINDSADAQSVVLELSAWGDWPELLHGGEFLVIDVPQDGDQTQGYLGTGAYGSIYTHPENLNYSVDNFSGFVTTPIANRVDNRISFTDRVDVLQNHGWINKTLDNWVLVNGTSSFPSDNLTSGINITSMGPSGYYRLEQFFDDSALTAGLEYEVTIKISAIGAGGVHALLFTWDSGGYIFFSGVGTYTQTFTVDSVDTPFVSIEGDTTVTIDYVYIRPKQETLTLTQTLDNPNIFNTSNSDNFGEKAAAISGNYAIVTAGGEDDAGGSASGAAYIFDVRTGSLRASIPNPNAYDTSALDRFGWAADISGNRAIVGAYTEDDAGGSGSGKAYVFTTANGSWNDVTLEYTIDNPNAYSTSTSDSFGYAVAISGDRAIVGAFGEDDASGTNSGKAYIFDMTTGNLLHTLDNPNAFSVADQDQFGTTVDITTSYAIVGSALEDEVSVGTNSGKAYIFDVSTGNLLYTLDNPNVYNTITDDNFGSSVAINEQYAVVGAPGEDNAGGAGAGAAYIYDTSTGNLLHTIVNPKVYHPSGSDNFGENVAVSDKYAIFGCRLEDVNAVSNTGTAYVYDLATGNLVYVLNNPNAYNTPFSDLFGSAVGISNGYAVVAAYGEDDAGGNTSGKAYVFKFE